LVFSALLLAWCAVDIRADKIPFSIGDTIGNPKAIPIALSVLVIYCGIKFIIEWLQDNDARRKQRAAQTDFWLCHWIGVFSIILYIFYQETARAFAQITDPYLDYRYFVPVLIGSIIFFWIVFSVIGKTSDYQKSPVLYWSSRGLVVLLLSPIVLFSTLGPDIIRVQKAVEREQRDNGIPRGYSLPEPHNLADSLPKQQTVPDSHAQKSDEILRSKMETPEERGANYNRNAIGLLYRCSGWKVIVVSPEETRTRSVCKNYLNGKERTDLNQ